MSSGPERQAEGSSLLLHASAVRFAGKGVILLGPSTSGKSDLALRLIDAGGVLIADDQVRLGIENGRLHASAPPSLQGLIELRGIGIMRVPFEESLLDLAVDLAPAASGEQLPEPAVMSWLGIDLPKITLNAEAASAVAKVRTVLSAERVF